MPEELQGWQLDPFGRREARYFSAGHPTFLVCDGRVEGSDPVEGIPLQIGLPHAEPEAGPTAEWLVPEQRNPRRYVDGITSAAASVVPLAWSAPHDVEPASPRHGTRGSRATVLAAVAVVCVVGVVAIAVAVTRRHRPSSASVSSATTTASLASSPAVPLGSPAVAAGVRVAMTGGHVAARFPSTPIQQSVSQTIEGVKAMIHVAVVRTPVTEVSEEDLASDVPTTEQAVALRSAIAVAARDSHRWIADTAN